MAAVTTEVIQVSIKENHGQNADMSFHIHVKTPLKYLIDSFLERKRYDKNMCKFTYKGHQIKDLDTPSSLKMQNKEGIDVFVKINNPENIIGNDEKGLLMKWYCQNFK